MRLLVVLPFCEGDQKLLLGLLGWIKDLGTLDNDCALVFSRNTNPDMVREVVDAASMCFKSVKQIPTPHSIGDESWPKGPNFLFATAAQHIQSARLGAWLWMEPDCVPTCEGWLGTLEKAYAKYGKPFMGPRLDPYKKVPGLAGCSVYPEDAYTRLKSLFPGIGVNKAWDVTCGKITEGVGQVTRLITHWWGQRNRPHTFKVFRTRLDAPHCKSVESIPKMCVLFHRCKDGSLIDILRAIRTKTPMVIPEISRNNELTVVITSHQRPKHLVEAFDSCLRAGVRNVIISATGESAAMSNVLDSIREKHPDVIILENGDATSNQSWCLGVEAASTKYVTILHDDDLLLPDYMTLVSPGISQNANFIMVQARNHGVPDYIEKDSEVDGLVNTSVLRPRLDRKGNLAISPLRGVFQKEDLSRWLRECELMPKSCYLRPGFLVGNDLAIWLKAVSKYSVFLNVPKPAVSFGHWAGSTTVDCLARGDKRLSGIYDETRRWLSGSITTMSNLPIHIVTIVLDGMPFITQHISVFNRLKIPWQWHIVEGAASNTHCTKWCKPQAGRLSNDGTTEYLNQIASHPRIRLYRKTQWDGKVEMVNAPLPSIKEECMLLEVDCDEFWSSEQIESMVRLFQENPGKTHAMFWCRYFFGPHLVMSGTHCYGNAPSQDWKRAWRFKPGDLFLRHEPPHLSSERDPLMHASTKAAGLVFDHYGYANLSQVQFKEHFYGYKDAVKHWQKLQQVRSGEVRLSDYLPWVRHEHSGTVKAIA